MTILNYKLSEIKAKRTNVETKNVEVTSNFAITSMKRESDKRFGEYLLVTFTFTVAYKPDIGKIEMFGSVWYQSKDLAKEITDTTKAIELKAEAVKEISTSILQESLVESIEIANKLRLPMPLKLPRVNVKPKELKFNKAA